MSKRKILIADDDMDLLQCLSVRARRMGLDVMTAYDGMSALTAAANASPDIICLDVGMPYGNGLSVCEMLSDHERVADTPVIIMTGQSDEQIIRRCHRLCAYYVEKSANTWERLEPIIRDVLGLPTVSRSAASQVSRLDDASLTPTVTRHSRITDEATAGSEVSDAPVDHARLQSSNRKLIDIVFEMLGADSELLENSPSNVSSEGAEATVDDPRPGILCIDDDPEYSLALKIRLESRGFRVERAYEGMQGFRNAVMRRVDAILLDYEMPNGHGDYILGRLKTNPITRQIPVIVVTGRRDRALERKMMNLGAAHFMTKPIDVQKLLDQLDRYLPDRKPVS